MRSSDHLDGASDGIRAWLHSASHPLDLSIPEIARSLEILDEIVARLPQVTRSLEAAAFTQKDLGIASDTGDPETDIETIVGHLGGAAGHLHNAQQKISIAHNAAKNLYRPPVHRAGK